MKEKPRLPKLLVPITRGLMSVFKRGDWRMGLKPCYQTKPAPCQANCPAENDIRGWLALVKKSEFKKALNVILKTSPFPGTCGTVCPHPCETNCNRHDLDEAVAINGLERMLGTFGTGFSLVKRETKPRKHWRKKKIAIVGSGPAGLSCAWQLLRRGYRVTIFEKSLTAGGMMTQAIPEFRLPPTLVKSEIKRILELGAELKTGAWVGIKPTLDELQSEFDAVFIATGAPKSKKLNIPGENEVVDPDGCYNLKVRNVIPGLDFLKDIGIWKKLLTESFWRVVVIGGGNTAIDAARSAKKYGSEIVTVVYRRSEEEMPAQKSEVEQAKSEGVNFVFLASPEEIRNPTEKIKTVVFRKMTLGEPDASGRKKPIPTNEMILVGATLIIPAIGEEPDLDPIIGPFGNKSAEDKKRALETMESQGIFIGGDALTGPSYVAQAIGQGREAAEKIICYFRGRPYQKTETPAPVIFKDLNPAYLTKTDRWHDAEGKAETAPETEASRCISCGLCPQDPETCKNCWQFCPDAAVEYKNGKFEINLDYCKGCLICSQECPRHVVDIKEEKKE